jgi:hypothetical protein
MTYGLLIYGEIFRHFLIQYMKPFLINDFATAPLWISLYMRNIWFSFLSVHLIYVLLPNLRYSLFITMFTVTNFFFKTFTLLCKGFRWSRQANIKQESFWRKTIQNIILFFIKIQSGVASVPQRINYIPQCFQENPESITPNGFFVNSWKHSPTSSQPPMHLTSTNSCS